MIRLQGGGWPKEGIRCQAVEHKSAKILFKTFPFLDE